ncbi:MAG: hypothetical protein AB7O43_21640 [Hyphomicrobiaceae bacterium]
MLECRRRTLAKARRYAAPAWAGLVALAAGLASATAEEAGKAQSGLKPAEANEAAAKAPPALTLEGFLDRLMIAESGGRDTARNSRSTAVGAFQFIRETFLHVVRRHFAEETKSLSATEVLALRENRAFARRAAAAYSKDNAEHLAREGLPASFTNLRLAFLAGPSGAVRVLRAPPQTEVSTLLSSAAIAANPFMGWLTAEALIARCARDLEIDPNSRAGIAANISHGASHRPRINVRCNLKLPSCRRWVALRSAMLDRKSRKSRKRQAVNAARK